MFVWASIGPRGLLLAKAMRWPRWRPGSGPPACRRKPLKLPRGTWRGSRGCRRLSRSTRCGVFLFLFKYPLSAKPTHPTPSRTHTAARVVGVGCIVRRRLVFIYPLSAKPCTLPLHAHAHARLRAVGRPLFFLEGDSRVPGDSVGAAVEPAVGGDVRHPTGPAPARQGPPRPR